MSPRELLEQATGVSLDTFTDDEIDALMAMKLADLEAAHAKHVAEYDQVAAEHRDLNSEMDRLAPIMENDPTMTVAEARRILAER